MNLLKKIFQKLNNSTTGNAIIIAIFSILAKILGLLRDRLLASQFGAGDVLDAYYAAFKLPDLIFNTLVLGALSAAFIPVFIDIKNKKTDDGLDHWQLSSAVINIILLVLALLSALVFIFAPQFVNLIAPGFSGDKLDLTINLTRIMLLSIFFFGISNVLSGILQSLKKFTMFALAPVMYNLGLIFGIVFLVAKLGPIGLGWGVVLGALLHLVVQLPPVIKLGFKWQPFLGLKQKAIRQIGKLMLPRTFGLAAGQVNQIVITIIASTLASGSLTVFSLAFNLQSVPISIFAVSLAIASFPVLSESFTTENKQHFISHLSTTLKRILYLLIPTSVFMIALRAQIVRLVLGAGAFDWTDTVLTAQALGFFCLSLFAQGLIPLLARGFYALQNTKIPVIVSIISVIVNIIGALLLAPELDVIGLALAFSIASVVNLTLLFAILWHKIGSLHEKTIIFSIVKIIVSTIGATVFLQMTKYIVASLVNMQTFIGVFLQFTAAGLVGVGSYLIISLILACEEVEVIKKYFRKRKITNYS